MKIGIDIGGTSTKFGFFDNSDVLIEEKIIETSQNYRQAINVISKNILEKSNVETVGIGLPGIINGVTGEVVLSVSLPDWSKNNLVVDLQKAINLPVTINNDAVCAAIAEIDEEKSKFIYLIWGTGIGGTVVDFISSKTHILPIEPGYQIVEWNGIEYVGCHKGCLSAYTAGGEIEKVYGKLPENIPENNDIWDKVSQKMAQGIINILVNHPSKRIIFGGGLINKQQHLLNKVKKYIALQKPIFDIPVMKLSRYGEKNGIYGAMMLPTLGLI